jgi:general nucleoside transport system ATP-binding protein
VNLSSPQTHRCGTAHQGLDIGATEDVWRLLLKARAEAGILLVTSDLNEALTLSDRLAVMNRGRLVDLFSVYDKEKLERIGQRMAGIDSPSPIAKSERSDT